MKNEENGEESKRNKWKNHVGEIEISKYENKIKAKMKARNENENNENNGRGNDNGRKRRKINMKGVKNEYRKCGDAAGESKMAKMARGEGNEEQQ